MEGVVGLSSRDGDYFYRCANRVEHGFCRGRGGSGDVAGGYAHTQFAAGNVCGSWCGGRVALGGGAYAVRGMILTAFGGNISRKEAERSNLMAEQLRVTLEIGPKGKKVAA